MKSMLTFFRQPITLVMLAVALITAIMLFMSTQSYLRRTQEMNEFMRQESILLIHALESAFRNTLLANIEVEQLIAQRLFDIGVMLDRELANGAAVTPELLEVIAQQHHILHIHLVDAAGRKAVSSSEELQVRSTVSKVFAPVYQGEQERITRGFREQIFSKRTTFGVALARSDGEGAIVLSVDATYVLQFQERIGLPALMAELVTQEAGIAYIAFYSLEGEMLHTSNEDTHAAPPLPEPLPAFPSDKSTYTGITMSGDMRVFDTLEPFYLNQDLFGFFRIGLEVNWLNASTKAMLRRLVGQGLIVALLLGIAAGFIIVYRRRMALRSVFSRYVSEPVMNNVLRQRGSITLGGERREATVLFTDIRGFTSYSEEADPEVLITQLNEYFAAMTDVIFAHAGTIDKFIGDAIMVVFGAPLPQADHARRAVETALDMLDALESLNQRWQHQGKPPFQIGIGINSGTMLVGHVGSERRMNYTVIGDAVNLASRIESLTKDYQFPLLITAATHTQAQDSFRFDCLGELSIRGRQQPECVYKVLGR